MKRFVLFIKLFSKLVASRYTNKVNTKDNAIKRIRTDIATLMRKEKILPKMNRTIMIIKTAAASIIRSILYENTLIHI